MMYVKYLTIISSRLLLPLLLLFLILREKMIRVGTLDSWGREKSGAIVLRQGTYLGQFTKNKVVKVFNTSWALSVICPSQTPHFSNHPFTISPLWIPLTQSLAPSLPMKSNPPSPTAATLLPASIKLHTATLKKPPPTSSGFSPYYTHAFSTQVSTPLNGNTPK